MRMSVVIPGTTDEFRPGDPPDQRLRGWFLQKCTTECLRPHGSRKWIARSWAYLSSRSPYGIPEAVFASQIEVHKRERKSGEERVKADLLATLAECGVIV
jgi:hypothetical protein